MHASTKDTAVAGVPPAGRRRLPAVDRLLRHPGLQPGLAEHGREVITAAIRSVLQTHRETSDPAAAPISEQALEHRLILQVIEHAARQMRPSLRAVFNLTGTVLHTNLGRAPLPPEALEAIATVSRGASNLEFDLTTGVRGERDDHISPWLTRLTGAPSTVVVNNNAAAVVLMLRALAARREVIVSRGELIELGGSFRLPDIMREAGCVLREVGTTNRTHLRDFAEAIGPRTALIMQVHTSNYRIEGYTHTVPPADLAALARTHGLPFAVDLGSGTLTDLTALGLPPEPTPALALSQGADLVTFSGDKLLGGPQVGLVVGRTDLIAKLRRHPLKRALRCDKMTLAALEAVLRLYADPARLRERVPALRWLTRPAEAIEAHAREVLPALQRWLRQVDAMAGPVGPTGQRPSPPSADAPAWSVEVLRLQSQIGSGSLPVEVLPSAGLCIRPLTRAKGRALQQLSERLRGLPVPVIGRVAQDALWLDLRCLDDPEALIAQWSETQGSEIQVSETEGSATGDAPA
jgi:L-seryl-tRNA(Ser) seleniumtransferase